MFDEAYTKLEVEEIATILDVLNKQFDGSAFDALETTILAIDVPFYPGYKFLQISDHATVPPLERFVFQKDKTLEFSIIDWSYKPIVALNKQAPIQLTDDNVLDYVRFYFSYVKGRYGRFIICESGDAIQWKEEPPLDISKSLNETIRPMAMQDKAEDGSYVIKAFMMLKGEIFSTDVLVKLDGSVQLENYEVLLKISRLSMIF